MSLIGKPHISRLRRELDRLPLDELLEVVNPVLRRYSSMARVDPARRKIQPEVWEDPMNRFGNMQAGLLKCLRERGRSHETSLIESLWGLLDSDFKTLSARLRQLQTSTNRRLEKIGCPLRICRRCKHLELGPR